jgi:hypothetical protein
MSLKIYTRILEMKQFMNYKMARVDREPHK